MKKPAKAWGIVAVILYGFWMTVSISAGILTPGLLAQCRLWIWGIGCILALLSVTLGGSGGISTILMAIASVLYTTEIVFMTSSAGKPRASFGLVALLFFGTAIWEYIRLHGKKK